MARRALSVLVAWCRCGELAARGSRPRRYRNRRTPGAESLEVRDCPSTLAPSLGFDRLSHASVATDHAAHQADPSHHEDSDTALTFKKKVAKGAQTIFVAPTGKLGLTAGKTAAHPLGSLTLAIKRAKPGATIVLAPGVYTQNPAISGKSDLTIVGAANQSSILSPPSGDGLKVFQSSNITIENVWFRASSGRGLTDVASSVDVQNIKTDGTQNDGVLTAGYGGVNAVLNATSSQFDSVRLGSGLELQPGSSATINGCTFNNDGTASGVDQSSNGMRVDTGAQANILNSQFIGNTNTGLVAYGNAQVTAQGSVFSGNRTGDGALFLDQATVNLTGDTFASNGEVVGESSGLNGVEFFGVPGLADNYTGTAVVSGNLFENNTANGLFIGSSSNTMQIVNNVFENNIVGLSMDSTAAVINATVAGNTFEVPVGTADNYAGILAIGSGVMATIGGAGAQENAIENYTDGNFIHEALAPGQDAGGSNLNIQANIYTYAGRAVPPSDAILYA